MTCGSVIFKRLTPRSEKLIHHIYGECRRGPVRGIRLIERDYNRFRHAAGETSPLLCLRSLLMSDANAHSGPVHYSAGTPRPAVVYHPHYPRMTDRPRRIALGPEPGSISPFRGYSGAALQHRNRRPITASPAHLARPGGGDLSFSLYRPASSPRRQAQTTPHPSRASLHLRRRSGPATRPLRRDRTLRPDDTHRSGPSPGGEGDPAPDLTAAAPRNRYTAPAFAPRLARLLGQAVNAAVHGCGFTVVASL